MAVLQQPGLLSALGFAKEAALVPGSPQTFVTAADLLDVESFQVTDDPSILQFPVMRQSRNVIQTTRTGIHKVAANFTMPFWSLQGSPLFAYGMGKDTITTVATPVLNTTAPASYAAGVQALTLQSALAAPPAGCGKDWVGATATIGTGGNQEKVIILAQPTSTTMTVTPLQNTHPNTDVMSIPVQHCYTEQTGTVKGLLSTVSLTAQFAQIYQWNLAYGWVGKMSLKGDTKNAKLDFGFQHSALPVDPGSLTAIAAATGETNDAPFIMRDGGIIVPFSVGGALSMHSMLLALTWDLDNGLIPREYGGGVQLAEFYIPGERKQSVTWKEDAGQNASGHPDIWTNFVQTQSSTPAFITFTNAFNGNTFTIHMPNCKVTKYDPVVGMAEPIGYDGALLPLEDGSTGGYGFASRIWQLNGVVTAY